MIFGIKVASVCRIASRSYWKRNRCCRFVFDDPESDERPQLDESEDVHAMKGYVLEEYVVRLVLAGNEEQKEPVKELEALKRGWPLHLRRGASNLTVSVKKYTSAVEAPRILLCIINSDKLTDDRLSM